MKEKYFVKNLLKISLVYIALFTASQNINAQTTIADVDTHNRQDIYIDESVEDAGVILSEVQTNNKTFQLFSHGRAGELLLNGEWMGAEKIAMFLKPRIVGFTQLNIYGCEFAKGEKGREAVAYLETILGINVAASDDITGKDGDWELEVGAKTALLQVPNYKYNLQCSTGRKYDVYAYYRSAGGHCAQANYFIQSLSGNIDVKVNQTVAPTDLNYAGKAWKKLTSTAIQPNGSNQIRVILQPHNSICDGGYILADAILLVDNFGNHYIIDNPKCIIQGNWTTTSNPDDDNGTCTWHQNNQNTSTSDQFIWDFFEKDHLLDSDGDGVIDACDSDDDNDGILDADEGCSTLANTNEQNGTFGTLASGTRDLAVNPGNGYAYVGDLNGEGRYVVVAHNNVANVHWSTHFDHIYGKTTGAANDAFLAVNGSMQVGVFYKQTLTLPSSASVTFGFWTVSGVPSSEASLFPFNIGIRIKDPTNTVVAQTSTGSITPTTWQNAQLTFNTTSYTSYTVEVYNISTAASGNDF
ncbi:MAG: DUF4347 domain-containing protein, partial [Paludibacteraceae bacterium]